MVKARTCFQNGVNRPAACLWTTRSITHPTNCMLVSKHVSNETKLEWTLYYYNSIVILSKICGNAQSTLWNIEVFYVCIIMPFQWLEYKRPLQFHYLLRAKANLTTCFIPFTCRMHISNYSLNTKYARRYYILTLDACAIGVVCLSFCPSSSDFFSDKNLCVARAAVEGLGRSLERDRIT